MCRRSSLLGLLAAALLSQPVALGYQSARREAAGAALSASALVGGTSRATGRGAVPSATILPCPVSGFCELPLSTWSERSGADLPAFHLGSLSDCEALCLSSSACEGVFFLGGGGDRPPAGRCVLRTELVGGALAGASASSGARLRCGASALWLNGTSLACAPASTPSEHAKSPLGLLTSRSESEVEAMPGRSLLEAFSLPDPVPEPDFAQRRRELSDAANASLSYWNVTQPPGMKL